ncbi:MAG: glycosyltransferase family 4 protein [Candidatus Desulfofervidaceae bacterium]|nr:glycosyltransferase family 4 protein [Candidatus Desulfofervidaceae bacterium]
MRVAVLHIVTRFLKWGGAERNTYYSIQGLDRERYDVDLAIGRDSQLDLLENYEHGQVLQIDSLVRDPNPLLDLGALFRLYRLIKSGNYDIVHTHTGKAGILGRIAARIARVPIIIHGLHGTMTSPNPVLDKIYLFLDRFTGRFTDCFISVGEDLKQRYIKRKIGDPSKYRVIHSGMDLNAFYKAGDLPKPAVIKKRRELGVADDELAVGMVASLEPRKGHKYAISAIRELIQHHTNIKLLFVGDGWYRAKLEELVRQNGLEDSIIFTGYREDIAEVIATFDIVILTSLWEGLPQVLVQSAAVGKPIVTFDVEGAEEVVQDGVNGFIVPLKDVDALVEKVEYLLSGMERAMAMGRQGRKIIGEQWTVETMQEKTRQLYEELLAGKR